MQEGKESLIAMTTLEATDARNVRQNNRRNQRPFDLGRLLAAEMGAYESRDDSLAGSQADSDAEDAVSLPSSAGHSSTEEHPDNASTSANGLTLPAPLKAAGLASKLGQLPRGGVDSWAGSSREVIVEGGLKPDSWHSSLQAPHSTSNRPSEEGAPLQAAALGSWADLLPAGGSASCAGGRADAQEPELAFARGNATAARDTQPAESTAASQGFPRSTEAADVQQSAAGGPLRTDSASDEYLIGAVHHGCRGLSEDSRSSSRCNMIDTTKFLSI